MSHHRHALPLLLWLTLSLAPLAVFAQGGYANLPEMGDRATTVLDADTADQIGEMMMKRIQAQGKLSDDPLVNDYIQRLGQNLVSASAASTQPFRFFVINERSINAFAMPGGYIGIHSGLLLASHSENELAAVMAHEIAHVTQHHIARSVEKAQQMNLPLTAAVIAAILLGASDPELGNAALAASMGASTQMQIDFTRANEKEADRVGMQLLAAAGFDPRGMADFFLRLQQESRFASDGVPEFLRTHPISSARMAEAQERAERYPSVERQDSINYQLTKARLMLQHGRTAELITQLEQEDPRLRLGDEATRYLRALLHQRQRNYSKARGILQALHQEAPQRIAYIDGLGRLEVADGKFEQAITHYQTGLEYYPANELLIVGLAESLMAAGEHQQAREILQQQLKRHRSAQVLRLLAMAEAALGNKVASHIAQAEYHLLLNEPHSAHDQLQTARRQGPVDDYHAARIDAHLEVVERLLERQN